MTTKLAQAGFRETTVCGLSYARLTDKTDCGANEDAVQIKFAVPDTSDYFIGGGGGAKARTNEFTVVKNVK